MKKMRVILASASPRRRELLKQIGIEFEIKVSNIEESAKATQPAALVEELSGQKAEAVLSETEPCEEDVLVIGADTVVALDDKVLGKPADKAEAVKMLKLLSGREHQVYTGVTFFTDREKLQKQEMHDLGTLLEQALCSRRYNLRPSTK